MMRADPQQSPQTSERFRVLTGVIAYTDPRQGFAIIGDSVQNTFLVRPGQRLPDGAWVREIHPKGVVLEREGSLETVGMHERAASPNTLYAHMPPLSVPQQARWEEPELKGETRRSEIPVNGARSNDAPPSETLSNDASPKQVQPNDVSPKQAQPHSPLPEATEPADVFGDARRQRADSGGR